MKRNLTLFCCEFNKGFRKSKKFIVLGIVLLFLFLLIVAYESALYVLNQFQDIEGTEIVEEATITLSEEEVLESYRERVERLKVAKEEYLKENKEYRSNFDTYIYSTNSEIAMLEYFINNGIDVGNEYNCYNYGGLNITESYTDFVNFIITAIGGIITVFAVIFAAEIIAGEYKSGAMKMVLLRPYTRNKIIFYKSLAVFAYTAFLVLLAFSLSAIYGAIRFKGKAMLSVVVFNAQNVFLTGGGQIFLTLFLVMLQMFFFIEFTLWLSTLSKNSSLTIGLSLALFLAGGIWEMVLGYIYIGYASFTINMDLGLFFNMSGLPLKGMNFYISLFVTLIYMAFFIVTKYLVFKKRDV